MKSSRRQPPKDTLTSRGMANDDKAIRGNLRQWIIHTRNVANGRDFLLSGPEDQIQRNLEMLVAAERKSSSGVVLTHVHLDEYVLLRITGPPRTQSAIARFFEEE